MPIGEVVDGEFTPFDLNPFCSCLDSLRMLFILFTDPELNRMLARGMDERATILHRTRKPLGDTG